MAQSIFLNIPVKDLAKSMDFFTKLGFTFNMQFTDDTAACMIIGENIYSMLLTEKKFREFTTKEITDTAKTAEMIIAISAESNAKVDEMVTNAIKAGGTETGSPKDYGFMYQRSFQDLDGHLWEVLYMDVTKVPTQ
ncbi:MAG TPA: VOC family protein [Bacteroidia bacterium]|nr:VOC family protein [Bacteroidia bacterium]